MDTLFSASALKNLPILVLYLAITLYLLALRRKLRTTWLLAGWFGALTLLALMQLASDVLLTARWSFYANRIGASTAVLLSLIPLIQFAYHFVRNDTPREARLVLWLSLLATGGLSAVFVTESWPVSQYVFPFSPEHFKSFDQFGSGALFDLMVLGGYAWAVVVLARKTIRLAPYAGRLDPWLRQPRTSLRHWLARLAVAAIKLVRPGTRDAHSARAFMLVVAGAVGAVALNRLEFSSSPAIRHHHLG